MRWFIHTILIIIMGFNFFACYPQDVNHNLDINGVEHSNLLTQGVEKCKGCHGNDLKGKSQLTVYGRSEDIASCYKCHGNMWNLDAHLQIHDGVRHQSLYSTNGATANALCGPCHGNTLLGEGVLSQYTRPSCTKCHEDLWSAITLHTVKKGGYNHAPGLFSPETDCISCHGSNLAGSGEIPSCNACHADLWTNNQNHSIMIQGVAHATGLFLPETNCTSCHGDSLQGTENAPSCSSCHGPLWTFEQTHTIKEDGYRHAPGLNSPWTDCTLCHGTNLNGNGNVPSCYRCHGAEWADDD